MTEFAPDLEVVTGLWSMLAMPGQFVRVAWSAEPGEPVGRGFHMDYAVGELRDFSRVVLERAEDRDVVVSAGLRSRRGMGSCAQSRVLWARCESRREAEALRRFRPVPSIVLREGSTCRLVALWQLPNPLNYEWVVRANRRIAHKLWGAKKWGTDLEFAFAVPGSCLRAGRARPVPVRVEAFGGGVYLPRDVVGKLKEAPDPSSWREKAAAA